MAEVTKKDILDTLGEFYGKVIEPRFDRIEKRLDGHDQKFKDILEHFDKIYTRLDRLETEYYSIGFFSNSGWTKGRKIEFSMG